MLYYIDNIYYLYRPNLFIFLFNNASLKEQKLYQFKKKTDFARNKIIVMW